MISKNKKFFHGCLWCFTVVLIVLLCFFWEEIGEYMKNRETGKLVYALVGHTGEAIAITTFLSFLFERWIWKWPLVNKLHSTPILAPSYKGILYSSYDKKGRECEFKVKQTFLSVAVIIKTNESYSGSIMADIQIIDGVQHLLYTYRNTPNAKVRPKSQIHFGTAMINIDNPEKLEVNYFTDRHTTGIIKLQALC